VRSGLDVCQRYYWRGAAGIISPALVAPGFSASRRRDAQWLRQNYCCHNSRVAHQAPINILIVDDEPKNLTVLEAILDDPGYRLVRAASAEQALLALLADEFALLILDVRMPDVTGFELAQMIKARELWITLINL